MDPHQIQTVAASAVLVFVTAVAVAVRLWARLGVVKSIEGDDVLILISWAFSFSLSFSIIAATHFGLGIHRNELSDEQYRTFLRLPILSAVLFHWASATARLSFVALYFRLLPARRGFRLLNGGLAAVLLIQAAAETGGTVFRCTPVRKAWETDAEGACAVDLPALWWFTFALNLLTALVIFLEPVPTMWKLQLPLAKRLGLIAMFSLGLLVIAISAVRLKYLTEVSDDETFQLTRPLVWSEIEVSVLIICSCVPSLRQVAARIPGLHRHALLPGDLTLVRHRGRGRRRDRGPAGRTINEQEQTPPGTVTATDSEAFSVKVWGDLQQQQHDFGRNPQYQRHQEEQQEQEGPQNEVRVTPRGHNLTFRVPSSPNETPPQPPPPPPKHHGVIVIGTTSEVIARTEIDLGEGEGEVARGGAVPQHSPGLDSSPMTHQVEVEVFPPVSPPWPSPVRWAGRPGT